ncbi:MAG: hypothetical protein GC134_08835 [Proteobacteria bacterium]|nr:hypothetical protein [Pseudomonadota bacterium]
MTRSTAARIADVTRIIAGRPAVSAATLPAVWHGLKADYVDAACLFAWHGTPLATEALYAIGNSFGGNAYPNLSAALDVAKSDLSRRAVRAIIDIEAELGRDVPAAFYEVLLATALRDEPESLMDMFKNRDALMQDRLWDAVLQNMTAAALEQYGVNAATSRAGRGF